MIDEETLEGLSDDQKSAFDLMMSGKNVFLTGEAGTGKSHLLRLFSDHCGKRVVRIASTGAAAAHIQAETAHKFFGLSVHVYDPGSADPSPEVRQKIAAADVIIYEECSMSRYDVIEQMLDVIRHSRPVTAEMPFGAQMIMVGDFAQLPPVLTNQERAKYLHHYGSKIYAFEHPCWKTFTPVVLKTVHRQKDREFSGWLGMMRSGVIPDLDYINERVGKRDPDSTALVSTNAAAKEINDQEMAKVVGNPITFTGQISGNPDGLSSVVPRELSLRAGAKVIICANDPKGEYVNGSQGKLVGKTQSDGETYAIVRLDGPRGSGTGRTVYVATKTWENVRHVPLVDDDTGEVESFEVSVIGTYDQMPLLPAWAITIHRSQGMTIDKLYVDPEGIFESGQAYVALSRATSIEGLSLGAPLQPSHVKTAPKVADYNRKIEGLPPIERPKGLMGLVQAQRDRAPSYGF